MGVILAALKKSDGVGFPARDQFAAALPERNAKGSVLKAVGRAILYSQDFGSVADAEEIDAQGWNFIVSGVYSKRSRDLLGPAVLDALRTGRGADPMDFPSQFSSVATDGERILGFVSAPGTDQLFHWENEDWAVVTNRHNLITLFMPLATARIRESALLSILAQNWIKDFGTIIEGVDRQAPCSIWVGGRDSGRIIEPRSIAWSSDLAPADLIDRASELAADYCEMLGSASRIKFNVSGGKDSRAILGLLLDGGLDPSRLSLATGGEPFAPDVMAAADLMEIAGLTQRWSSSRPSFSRPGFHFENALSWDLWVDSAGTSLADLRSIPPVGWDATVGGHEIGFKQPPNSLPIDEYLDKIRRHWYSKTIVKREAMTDFVESYVSRTEGVLEGAPLPRFNAVELRTNHIATHTSGSLTSSNLGAFEVHPMLDLRALDMLVGTSNELASAQFIHYAFMRQAPKALEIASFANDTWPSQLDEFARAAGAPFRGRPAQPYEFFGFFPTQKNYGLHNWRYNLLVTHREWMKQYLHDFGDELSWIDVEVAGRRLDSIENISNFRDLYVLGNLLKVCLVHHFGVDSWLLEKRPSIEEEISSFRSGTVGGGSTVETGEDQGESEAAAVAAAVRTIRDVQAKRDHDVSALRDELQATRDRLNSTETNLQEVRARLETALERLKRARRELKAVRSDWDRLQKRRAIVVADSIGRAVRRVRPRR